MDDPYAESNTNRNDDRVTSEVGLNTGTPRWVKVFGTILILVILLFVIMLFTPGPHGPGRHLRPGSGGQPPTAERGGQQP
ncbi:MAG: hypothetical protein ACR2G5_13350 [Pyrinomonadaceae bacterium]